MTRASDIVAALDKDRRAAIDGYVAWCLTEILTPDDAAEHIARIAQVDRATGREILAFLGGED